MRGIALVTLAVVWGCAMRMDGALSAPAPAPSPSASPAADPTALQPDPAAPADPWLGVDGDQPRKLPVAEDGNTHWQVRTDEPGCTAARDHCMPPLAWVAISEPTREGERREVNVFAMGPRGPEVPWNTRNATCCPQRYTAYRTVPATRRNLKTGAMIIGLRFPAPHPDSQKAAVESGWVAGPVERIDWELGFVFVTGEDRPLSLTSARTTVLSWKPGGKVTILGGAKRDQLAVGKQELILPAP